MSHIFSTKHAGQPILFFTVFIVFLQDGYRRNDKLSRLPLGCVLCTLLGNDQSPVLINFGQIYITPSGIGIRFVILPFSVFNKMSNFGHERTPDTKATRLKSAFVDEKWFLFGTCCDTRHDNARASLAHFTAYTETHTQHALP